MSGLAATATLPRARREVRVPSVPALAVELGVFAAMGAFALVQWARLLDAPPTGKLAAGFAVACCLALALAALGRTNLPRGVVFVCAAFAAAAGILAALVATGLPARLLEPAHWDELGAKVSNGLGGIQNADLPYDGERTWTRLVFALGAPLALGLAAAAAFWPARRRGVARGLGLVPLLVLYGTAVTLHAPPNELLLGLVLLLLVAAWLWVPFAGPRGGAVLVSALVAGGLAVPLADALDTDRPWWDYERWTWFTNAEEVGFDWNHSYGPLEWPQEGTTLLEVRSDRPQYWKTAVLDRFDGFTWQRADPADPLASSEVAARETVPLEARTLAAANPEWIQRVEFNVRNLRSDLLVGAGTPLAVLGKTDSSRTGDGTVRASTTLGAGDEYAVLAYSPQPSPGRMRRAPQTYPPTVATGATLIGLPTGTDGVGTGFGSSPPIEVPRWGEPRGESEELLANSAYGQVYELARQLTDDAPTIYDAVAAVERHLSTTYDYTHTVPEATYPLAAFLFDHEAGYCQQFSGAMALMLRMVGIPARVVSGFAPGRYVAEDDLYEVSDTDAHSWVEVYFTGIGWVAFDPTPASAPAAAQIAEEGGPAAVRRDGSVAIRGQGLAGSIEEALEGGSAPPAAAGESGGRGNPLAAVIGVGAAAGGAWLLAAYVRRRRRLSSPGTAELQARELVSALRRLGWTLPAGVTLHALEARFESAGRTAIARYARALGRYRFEPGPARLPGAAERRALRRALAKGGGPRRRWRALRAIPPGGPAVGT